MAFCPWITETPASATLKMESATLMRISPVPVTFSRLAVPPLGYASVVSAPKYTKPLAVTFRRLDKTLKVSFFTTVKVQVVLSKDMSSVSADMMINFSSSVRSAGNFLAKRAERSKGMLTAPSSLPILPPGRNTTRLPTTLGSSIRV